jgi:hypothetical protein
MFDQIDEPIPVTLHNWFPKVNNEMETRLRLVFEVPLNESVLETLPEPLQRLAAAVGKLEDGITEGTLSTEYQQSLEMFESPGTDSILSLENVQMMGMQIFRPTPKEGPEDQLFLTFSTTVRAEGEFGDRLVTWALRHLRRTVFVKAYALQGRLPLEAANAA